MAEMAATEMALHQNHQDTTRFVQPHVEPMPRTSRSIDVPRHEWQHYFSRQTSIEGTEKEKGALTKRAGDLVARWKSKTQVLKSGLMVAHRLASWNGEEMCTITALRLNDDES